MPQSADSSFIIIPFEIAIVEALSLIFRQIRSARSAKQGGHLVKSPRVVSLPLALRLPRKVLDSLSTETEDNLPDWTTGKNRGSKMMKMWLWRGEESF